MFHHILIKMLYMWDSNTMQRDEDLSHVILDLTRRGRNRLKVCPVRTSSFQNSLANLSVKSMYFTTKQNICAKTSLSPLSYIGD